MIFDKRELNKIMLGGFFIAILSTTSMFVSAKQFPFPQLEEQVLIYAEADIDSTKNEHSEHEGHHGTKSGDRKHGKCNMFRGDTNKDGKISREEFMTRSEQKFTKKDSNKDGFIDKDEMHQMKKNKYKHGHDSEKAQCKMKQ